jgi:hypothetical protein
VTVNVAVVVMVSVTDTVAEPIADEMAMEPW